MLKYITGKYMYYTASISQCSCVVLCFGLKNLISYLSSCLCWAIYFLSLLRLLIWR